jgi:hypothetical protein
MNPVYQKNYLAIIHKNSAFALKHFSTVFLASFPSIAETVMSQRRRLAIPHSSSLSSAISRLSRMKSTDSDNRSHKDLVSTLYTALEHVLLRCQRQFTNSTSPYQLSSFTCLPSFRQDFDDDKNVCGISIEYPQIMRAYLSFYPSISLQSNSFPSTSSTLEFADIPSLSSICYPTASYKMSKIVICGWNETITDEFFVSIHPVFRLLTAQASVALHYYNLLFEDYSSITRSSILRLPSGLQSTTTSEIEALSEFLIWLSSYQSLFSTPCLQCGHILHSEGESYPFLPAIIRTHHFYLAFHFHCYQAYCRGVPSVASSRNSKSSLLTSAPTSTT